VGGDRQLARRADAELTSRERAGTFERSTRTLVLRKFTLERGQDSVRTGDRPPDQLTPVCFAPSER
jgi:hypothetical protein